MIKKEDAEPLKSPDLIQKIIEKAPAGVIILNISGRITDFNPAAAAITGCKREDAMGHTVLEVLTCEVEMENCPIRAAMEGKEVESQELTVLNHLNQSVPLMFSAFPLKSEEGELLGGAMIFRDLSTIKHLENERRQLVNMFAHDLKTPVVGVSGLIRRLRQGKVGPISEPQLSYLDTISSEMEGLEKIINNFLEFVRLDLHILTPLSSALHVDKECQEVMTVLSPLAEAKNIELQGEYPQEILVIQADPLLFRRVLENLIGNAIKYSPPRTRVTLKAQAKGEEVLFSIQDQGPGIPPEDLPHIFEIYYRGSLSGKERGFGLGLATVKRIIEIHGGRLWVESQPAKGSTFYFTLPR